MILWWTKTARPAGIPDTIEDEVEQNVYLLTAGYPTMEGHELKAYTTSAVDFSDFKLAEQVQSRVTASAKQGKWLQENFSDIVSHEMRDPLSAITQLGGCYLRFNKRFRNNLEGCKRCHASS